ncbi:MAG: DUF2062 domain-containing protein [Lentisphaeria bacterium]|nr:DUF2062 domain-containing protein [Lentisphaeria bacterium]
MRRKNSWLEKSRRLFRYYYDKAIREQGTPEYIARGWAIGMFIGFAVPFGLQLIISIPLSFLLKGSKLGASVGTLVTNHITIIVIYPFQCWLGSWLIGKPLELEEITSKVELILKKQDYQTLFSLGSDLVISFFIGGFLLAAVSTPICYYLVKRLVIHYRQNKEKRRLRKQEQLNGRDPGDH